ncbi:MAG: hypothetical protein HPY50_19660 [Firmicutes bacterium]|nr:hypothetical protein [Bacillota bacterium]
MSKKKKDPPKTDDNSVDTVIRLMTRNKGLALSFAVALAVANIGGITNEVMAAAKAPDKNPMVLEKEKEKEQDEAEREWDVQNPESYGNYGAGYYGGYYYSPFHFIGSTNYGRATWSTSTSKKTVGGYSIFRGTSTS